MQLAMDFSATRARSNDSATSKEAAKHAAAQLACQRRIAILHCLRNFGPQTAREISARIGVDYIETQRRISEVGFIEKTTEVRDRCHVWKAV